MDSGRGRDEMVPECPENKFNGLEWTPLPDTILRSGVGGWMVLERQSYSDANRWSRKREPSPRRARPIEITYGLC